MAEEKSDVIKSTVNGWIKTLAASGFSLLTGAVIMYLTPLVNNAIKPPKPLANFATEVNGLTVQFNNRSAGATQGWWDFGDGSALEPFDPKTDLISHSYAKPGTYTVKLSLKNILGEENDRSTQVTPTLTPSSTPMPSIAEFKVEPIPPDAPSPATYRVQAKVTGAALCILSAGDNRPTEIVEDGANLVRYVTYRDMGAFVIRLSAANGKQVIEKSHDVYVNPSASTETMAKLIVHYDAIRIERHTRDLKVYCGWQGDVNASVSSIRKERPADVGCTIVSAELANKGDKNSAVRNANVSIAPDKTKLILTAELARATGVLAQKSAPPSWLADVKVVMERRSPVQTINRGDIMMPVSLNTTTRIPLQPLESGWEVIKKRVNLELWEGNRKLWEGDKATAARVTLKNQACLVTAMAQGDAYLLKIDSPSLISAPTPTPTPPGVGPIRKVGFEFNPLLPKRPK